MPRHHGRARTYLLRQPELDDRSGRPPSDEVKWSRSRHAPQVRSNSRDQDQGQGDRLRRPRGRRQRPSQGLEAIVDWFLDDNNRWTFRETASVVPQGPAANTWTSNVFKVKRHGNGEVTYYFMSSDITRGIDIFKWRGPSNPRGTPPPATTSRGSGGAKRTGSSGRSSGTVAFGFLGAALLAPLARRRRTKK